MFAPKEIKAATPAWLHTPVPRSVANDKPRGGRNLGTSEQISFTWHGHRLEYHSTKNRKPAAWISPVDMILTEMMLA